MKNIKDKFDEDNCELKYNIEINIYCLYYIYK